MLGDRGEVWVRAAPVAAITALAAVLRFATLDGQSFGHDEAITVDRLEPGLLDTLDAVRLQESTPPLYYALAWAWTQLFGEGEVGVRSLSALAGTAAVPVVYLAARTLATRRVGLIAALLVAVHPMMVWFSQEARAYSLLVLMSALSLLFFARALERPTTGNLGGWAAASALALVTHYFAVFLVVAEAAWLVARVVPRRRAVVAVGAVGAAGVAVAPLALAQADERVGWIAATPFGERVRDIGSHYVAGVPVADLSGAAAAVGAAGAVAAVLLLAALGRPDERRAGFLALGLGAATLALAAAAAAAGSDYVINRNVLFALVPLSVGVAAGFGARRAGWVGPLLAVGLAVTYLAHTLAIANRPELQRADWRAVAESLPDGVSRLIVGPNNAGEPLLAYLPRAERSESVEEPPAVSEVVTVGWAAPEKLRPSLPAEFAPVRRTRIESFGVVVFRSPRPVVLDPAALTATDVGAGPQGRAAVLVEP